MIHLNWHPNRQPLYCHWLDEWIIELVRVDLFNKKLKKTIICAFGITCLVKWCLHAVPVGRLSTWWGSSKRSRRCTRGRRSSERRSRRNLWKNKIVLMFSPFTVLELNATIAILNPKLHFYCLVGSCKRKKKIEKKKNEQKITSFIY